MSILLLLALKLFLCNRLAVVIAVAAATAANEYADDDYTNEYDSTTTPDASIFVTFRNQFLPYQLVP